MHCMKGHYNIERVVFLDDCDKVFGGRRFKNIFASYCLRNKVRKRVQKVSDDLGNGSLVPAVVPKVLSTINRLSKQHDTINKEGLAFRLLMDSTSMRCPR